MYSRLKYNCISYTFTLYHFNTIKYNLPNAEPCRLVFTANNYDMMLMGPEGTRVMHAFPRDFSSRSGSYFASVCHLKPQRLSLPVNQQLLLLKHK